MTKNIKLVAIDLDGTLLDRKKNVPIENIKAIKKLKDKNIHVVIATGRPVAGFSWILDRVKLRDKKDYSITNTGSLIIRNSDNKEIFSKTLTIEDFKKVKNLAKSFDLQVGFYNRDYLYNNVDLPDKIYQNESNVLKMQIKKFDEDRFSEKIERICLTGDPLKIDKFSAAYEDILLKNYQLVRSLPEIDEVLNKDCDKGKALRKISEFLQVDTKEVLAIGDSENDRSMLEIAGISATSINANDHIKNLVDFVCQKTNDEASVSQIIEKIVFSD